MSITADLSGRTALITGASSGLGSRFGRILAASGANVALSQLSKKHRQEFRNYLNSCSVDWWNSKFLWDQWPYLHAYLFANTLTDSCEALDNYAANCVSYVPSTCYA